MKYVESGREIRLSEYLARCGPVLDKCHLLLVHVGGRDMGRTGIYVFIINIHFRGTAEIGILRRPACVG